MEQDEAGKFILDGSEPCECGHSLDWHDEDGTCKAEDFCACKRFRERMDD